MKRPRRLSKLSRECKLLVIAKRVSDVRRKPLEFQVGDRVMLKVSPWKGVVHFGKRGKLNPSGNLGACDQEAKAKFRFLSSRFDGTSKRGPRVHVDARIRFVEYVFCTSYKNSTLEEVAS
ncbi:hypothetical protein Tco_1284928 [Tanacetum coccineum]